MLSPPTNTVPVEKMSRPKLRIGVIGGGVAGITTLKHALEAKTRFGIDVEAQVFEAEAGIGGVFRYRVWEEAEVSCI